jgi:DMSO reductase anchor subunit
MTILDSRYEQLIDDLCAEYRPQREWAEGRGFFLIVGHFLVGLAAGAWLFGLIFGDHFSLIGAWLLAGLGGLAHLVNIARPGRAFRMMTQARTSWVSRGFWGLVFFMIGGTLYLWALLVPSGGWNAASGLAQAALVLSVIGALILICYMGFVYTSSKGIPFWDSTLHPVLYISYAARGGAAMALLSIAYGTGAGIDQNTLLGLWLAATAIVAILWILEIQGAYASRDESAIRSVHDILAGRLALSFYAGMLVIGLILPAVLVAGIVAPMSAAVMGAVGIASVVGDFFMKYASIKAGIYLPLRLP